MAEPDPRFTTDPIGSLTDSGSTGCCSTCANLAPITKRRSPRGLAEFDALVVDYTRLFGASAPRTLRLRDERESVRRG